MSAPPPSLRRGFSWLLGGQVLVRVVVLAGVVVLSRLVGPARLGDYAVATALLSYAAVLGDAGLTTWAQREIVRDPTPAAASRVATATVVVQLACALLAALLLLLVLAVLPVSTGALRLTVVALPLLAFQCLSLLHVIQSYERMDALSALQVLSQLVATVGGVALVAATGQLVWMPVLAWTGVAAADVGALLVVRRLGLHPVRVRRGDLTTTARGGTEYLLSGMVVQILVNLDVVVVGIVAGARAAGLYGAAYRVTYAVLLLAGVVVTAVFPRLVRTWDADRDAFGGLARQLVLLSARLTLPLTAVVVVVAPELVVLVYGRPYAAAGAVLQVLFVWVPLGWLNTMAGQALLAAGFARAYLTVAAVSAASAILLLTVLVPAAGPRGAGVAVALTEVVTTIGFAVAGRTRTRVPLVGTFARQGAYLVLPLAVSLLARAVAPHQVLLLAPGLTLIALLAFERLRHDWTLRVLVGARRGATDAG